MIMTPDGELSWNKKKVMVCTGTHKLALDIAGCLVISMPISQHCLSGITNFSQPMLT